MKEYICFISGKVIPQERAEFLLAQGIAEHELTSVECSITKKKQGLMIDDGLTVARKVYNDSVKSVFHSDEEEPFEVVRSDEDDS